MSDQVLEPSTTDAFDAAVTSASTYVEPPVAARDTQGRFAGTTTDVDADAPEVETPADAAPVETKPAEKKPRNDPQARIDQVIKEREDARREAARLKAELDAARAPKAEPPPAAAPETFTDYASYLQTHPDATLEQWLDARDKWRDAKLKQEARVEAEKVQREQTFTTKAQAFSEQFKAAPAEVQARIDQKFFTAKPLSTLTAEDKAQIGKIPDQQTRDEFAFLCFLADQWIDSEHAVDLLAHISEPTTFQRLATLPPNQVIRELARVEARLGAASDKDVRGPAPKPSASQANPPIKPLGTTPHAPAADDGSEDESLEKYITRENAKDRKAGRL